MLGRCSNCAACENICNANTQGDILSDHWEVIQRHVHGREFSESAFFDEWFYRRGRAYTILFKRHLGITNLQFAELYALLRQYTSETSDERVASEFVSSALMFHNSHDFKSTLKTVVESLLESMPTDPETIDWTGFSAAYDSLLKYSMILDARYGSCSLLVPPNLSVALAEICVQSGYVDSCGLQIYARSFEKVVPGELVDSLKAYLKVREDKGFEQKVHFAVWAHEHFPPQKNDGTERIRDGIDALKLYQDKLRLGKTKLWGFVKQKIESDRELKARLHVAEAGDDHRDPPRGLDGTIWLLQDRSIEYLPRIHPGSKRFLLCYHQVFKNCNPLHVFDENKPAWVAPVTIPHSLLGAMVNLSRPWPKRVVKIHDPFCGTGSLVLEMLKDGQACATGGDLAPETPLLYSDNLAFLASPRADLERFANNLSTVAAKLKVTSVGDLDVLLMNVNQRLENLSREVRGDFSCATEMVSRLKKESIASGDVPSYSFSQDILAKLETYSLQCRLFFYAILRAELSHAGAGGRRDHKWSDGFAKSADQLAAQIRVYAIWQEREDCARQLPRLSAQLMRHDGKFAMQLSVSHATFSEAIGRGGTLPVCTLDATNADAHEDDYYDVVVTDPPYGFNTEEDVVELAKLYAALVRVWVKKVAPKGHLIICLPEETYNGQALPFCTSASLVTVQVLAAVSAIGKRVVNTAKVRPSSAPGLSPPYYWESDKVLRRVILHFQIDWA